MNPTPEELRMETAYRHERIRQVRAGRPRPWAGDMAFLLPDFSEEARAPSWAVIACVALVFLLFAAGLILAAVWVA